MVKRVEVNFIVLSETRDKIKQISEMTYRGYGDIIDWLIAEKWKELMEEDVLETLEEEIEHRR